MRNPCRGTHKYQQKIILVYTLRGEDFGLVVSGEKIEM
jgi:hypothetical protein